MMNLGIRYLVVFCGSSQLDKHYQYLRCRLDFPSPVGSKLEPGYQPRGRIEGKWIDMFERELHVERIWASGVVLMPMWSVFNREQFSGRPDSGMFSAGNS